MNHKPSSAPEPGTPNPEPGQFSRIERLIGAAGLQRLRAAHVAVVGLGAVGSYATEALARAGVGRLRLVDFDEVRASNLNRQLFALNSTLGRKKAGVALARVRDINPACQAEALEVFVHVETLDQVLAGPPELVIDAIDALTPKVELLAALLARKIPVVSCMGAALRTDPLSIRVGPLKKTQHCPLARRVRYCLRQRKLPLDLTCVYSVEPVAESPETAVAGDGEGEADSFARGRTRHALGSLPTLTGIVGLTAANTALKMLLDGIGD